MKRLFDLCASCCGLVLLSPLFLILILAVKMGSKGPAFYKQVRIGRGGQEFSLLKFRSMRVDSDKEMQLTVGDRDPRITGVGYFLRRTKLDELPQLINVLKGEMSIVGPRPEVPKYVAMYSEQQRKVLTARPGLTDPASIAYINENALLAESSDPEKTYVEQVMPAKLAMNLAYLEKRNFFTDLGLVFKTFGRIFS